MKLYKHQEEAIDFLLQPYENDMHGRMLIHEQGCIEGDAIVTINRAGGARKMSLRQVYEKFHHLSGSKKKWDLTIPTKIRCYYNGEIRTMEMKNIYYKGKKDTLQIELEDGKIIRGTHDHEFLTDKGWVRANKLAVGDVVLTNGERVCKNCDSKEKLIKNKYSKDKFIPKQSKIKSITNGGVIDVYDVTVPFADSFVANGIIVHNCGKTITSAMAAKAKMIESGIHRALVICPATLKFNWEDEIKKLFPFDRIYIISGEFDKHKYKNADWVIINYDILHKYNQILCKEMWEVVICDEAHYLKGMSRRFFSFFGKKKKSKSGKETFESLIEKTKDIYLLTGTPVNKPLDFYNLLRICNHPVSRNYTFYSNRYCGPQKNAFGTAYKGASNLKELHKKIQNVVHRRTKEECLDLPEKTRRVIPLQVSQKAIEKFYEDFLTEKKRDKKIGVSHIAKFMKFSQAIGIEKAKQGIHIAEDIIENDGKVVIFTNFTDVVKIYEEHFKNRCVKIVGGMSDDERKKAVKRFQEGDAEVFIGNIKAAGVGLTLTKSCHTLVNDLSCVVTEHLQAEDRIHRISQTRNVTISYLSARDTIEADVMRILLNKLDNASIILDGVKAVNNNILADLYKILERESK